MCPAPVFEVMRIRIVMETTRRPGLFLLEAALPLDAAEPEHPVDHRFVRRMPFPM
jgi:hypothetical protein